MDHLGIGNPYWAYGLQIRMPHMDYQSVLDL